MAVGPDLKPPSLAQDVKFNCAIFFLFYFNRAFAKVISILARVYLRWTGNPRYIDIQSLQISILAGRLFFGKVTYHGPNETIIIVGGHITWRYWLRRVRQVVAGDNRHVDGAEPQGHHGRHGKGKASAPPCRILVELKGVEWFIYNRSASYDYVMEEMTAAATSGNYPQDPPASSQYAKDDDPGKATPKTGSTTLAPRPSHTESASSSSSEAFEKLVASSPYLQMLPIKIECSRGAVVMGNNNTPSILVAHFEKASGTVEARKSRSIDQYTEVFDLTFTHPTIQLKPNANFKEPLLTRAAREQAASNPEPSSASQADTPILLTRRQRFRELFPLLAASVESFMPSSTPRMSANEPRGQWMGLSRYLDSPAAEAGWKFEPEEYALESNLLDCSSATFCLYWDYCGIVPLSDPPPREGGKQRNGSSHPPPEFGLHLTFTGGTIHYGPWADRQRIALQNMFFPKLYKSASVPPPLSPGDNRVYTDLKIFIELSSSTILNIPIRESSKDWKYRRRLDEGEVRPRGWLEIKVAAESSVTYNMSYLPSSSGWDHSLSLELRQPEVRTSVNHGLLYKAVLQTLSCDLSGPLKWNADTEWTFNFCSEGMSLFLLRDHVTLLTDLATDWTSGPAAEYWTFVPMVYGVNLRLHDTEILLNVNERNIIDNPSSLEDNAFLILRNFSGQRGYLKAGVKMDFREFRAQSSRVEFAVENWSVILGEKSYVDLGVGFPRLGRVSKVKLEGSYEFFSKTAADLVDTLRLDLTGDGVEFWLHGFLIRYFLGVKENYFGEWMRSRTLEEWQTEEQMRQQGQQIEECPFVKGNDIDVVLGIKAGGLSVRLPKGIYGGEECVRIDTPQLGLGLRFTNYYMDLQVDLSPLSLFHNNTPIPELFLEHLTISGHRLFGLPPIEPTYICHWDLSLGSLSGEASFDFLQTLLFAARAFTFSLADTENALPSLEELIIHDITFIRLSIAGIRLWLHTEGSSVLRLSAEEVKFVLNDLADPVHSERITLKVPGLEACVMEAGQMGDWNTKGYIATELQATVLGRKYHAAAARHAQQQHVRASDRRTDRAPFLLSPNDSDLESAASSLGGEQIPSSMALPPLPHRLPLDPGGSVYSNSDTDTQSQRSHRSRKSLGAKSSRSFLMREPTQRPVSMVPSMSSIVPSFYSALESLSDVALMPGNEGMPAVTIHPPDPPRTLPPLTPTTAGSSSGPALPPSRGSLRASGTPTRSSFRGGSLEMTSRPLGVSLNSPFERPRFPLDDVEPDLHRVPVLEQQRIGGAEKSAAKGMEMFTDEEASRDAVILEFLPGVRGFVTPSAMKDIAGLLEYIQPRTAEEVLDEVQRGVISRLKEVVKKVELRGSVLEVCIRMPEFRVAFIEEAAMKLRPMSGASGRSNYTNLDGAGAGYALELGLKGLFLAGRQKKTILTERGDRDLSSSAGQKIKTTLSAHVVLDLLTLEMKDLSPPPLGFMLPPLPAARIKVENILFWASTAETATASLKVGKLDTTIQGTQALFLHDSLLALNRSVDVITARFESLSRREKRRIQHCISTLAAAGEERKITQDPATLTRPSYVLRSATNHVRLNDSWKILTRLRHVWRALGQGAGVQGGASQDSQGASQTQVTGPRTAREELVSILKRWRGWELGQIEESVIVRAIFGDDDGTTTAIQQKRDSTVSQKSALRASTAAGAVQKNQTPLKAEVNIDVIQLRLDPGPSQHEFVIDQISASVCSGSNNQGLNADATAITTPGMIVGTVVQVHSSSIRAGARWEILDVVEEVIKGLQSRRQNSSPQQILDSQGNSPTIQSPTLSRTTSKKGKDSSKAATGSGGLHVIFTTDHGSLSLDTVNLRLTTSIQSLKATLIISSKPASPLSLTSIGPPTAGSVASLLLRASSGSTELITGNKILSRASISTPSLYGFFDQHSVADTEFCIWKVTAAAEEVRGDVYEQLLGLVEVADFVVQDEVSHIVGMMEKIKAKVGDNNMDTDTDIAGTTKQKNIQITANPGSGKRQVHMIYATLSLDRFGMSAMLLPSLGYIMRGEGVRLSARPNQKNRKETVIDFGLEHHEHEICKKVAGHQEDDVISLLKIPAITASFRDNNMEEERVVDASISVDEVVLDASSIQSLLNAVKKPEVVKVVENARDEIRGIDLKFTEILAASSLKEVKDSGKKKSTTSTPSASKPLVYNAYTGIAGLKIQTNAPTANLEVNLGFIQAHASNRSSITGAAISFPEIRLDLENITVELTRTVAGVKDVCGSVELRASLHASSQPTANGSMPAFHIKTHDLNINLHAETASAVVDVVGHLQDKLRDLDLSREVKYLRKLKHSTQPLILKPIPPVSDDTDTDKPDSTAGLFNLAITMEIISLRLLWLVASPGSLLPNGSPVQNLVFSFKRIFFSTATEKANEANLVIEEFMLQMLDATKDLSPGVGVGRSENSALMPEVTFRVAYSMTTEERRLAFQAKGRSLDLRLTSDCVIGANGIQDSISKAVGRFRDASSSWKSTPTIAGEERGNMFSSKRMASVLVDADFQGAVVQVSSRTAEAEQGDKRKSYGQYSQGQGEANGVTVLRSPGLAFKVEYSDPVDDDPSLSAEIKVSGSDNTLYPSVVPLIIEMSDNVKDIMKEDDIASKRQSQASQISHHEIHSKHDKDKDTKDRPAAEEAPSYPAAILGKCRLNIGLRILSQEFTLSCQPIARVAASTGYDLIYATISTCDDALGRRFYSTSATISGLRTSLQHVYSRESTGTLEIDTVTISLLNNKHILGSAGLSCMLKSSPIKAQVNIKQFQDFLLFREIWYPAHLRNRQTNPPGPDMPLKMVETSQEKERDRDRLDNKDHATVSQRYHKVAATNAFPWNITIAVEEVELLLDLGQSLGKSSLLITSLWATSRKTSDWEQTMCLGFDAIKVSSTGRLSGYIVLQGMKVKTSINWDSAIESLDVVQTPLVEASIGFKQLQSKIVFDYQAFLLADIGSFNFLMYNRQSPSGDSLVGVLDGDKVQIYCTTLSAAQGLALYQACQRLAQDKMASFELSLKEVESFLSKRRGSYIPDLSPPIPQQQSQTPERRPTPPPIPSPQGLFKLHTDVVVNLKEVHFGVFPSTFYDTQIFNISALNATARFAVCRESAASERIQSTLSMTLGELSVALSPVQKHEGPGGALADVEVEKVIAAVFMGKQKSGNKGIILRVPQVEAGMSTWHKTGSYQVDYEFKSSFEGKVDVGWNFQRVGVIKSMYHTHAKAVAQRQGRAPASSRISMFTDLNPPAGGSTTSSDPYNNTSSETHAERKITAVVDVPQSKYSYNAVEPPIIETPQLRDMGEATPPMEWIGLHRERLPHLTHQIVIVSLLEIAREVEDAYAKILGSS
ncbi:Similar to Protein CSF1; acc. no. Q12150 [Pyronema omphalodes CBS 100304]|uniref:Similar to Protein CSF1 acc. no. Q12150 n=1 Tax=Pyronema omphalodes (strain CBS 100304) TaxID=1076935 RepID=U4LNP7_PYROM|nr:Similar to Protein CSF1; acc. no. Q12150 [Pyronema omphalodes CBS 100304]